MLPEIGEVAVYEGELLVSGWIRASKDVASGSHELRIEASYQACGHEACAAPETLALALPIEVSGRVADGGV
jgi:hypothetical protein